MKIEKEKMFGSAVDNCGLQSVLGRNKLKYDLIMTDRNPEEKKAKKTKLLKQSYKIALIFHMLRFLSCDLQKSNTTRYLYKFFSKAPSVYKNK